MLKRDDADGTLASRMEAELRKILKRVPGADPIPQFPVGASRNYRIDFAYPEIRLGIEAQSIKWHLGEARFVYDLKRDRQLKEVGWTVLYYSWDDLLRPVEIASEIGRWREKLAMTLV